MVRVPGGGTLRSSHTPKVPVAPSGPQRGAAAARGGTSTAFDPEAAVGSTAQAGMVDESGKAPLGERVNEWRIAYGQGGDPGLAAIADFNIYDDLPEGVDFTNRGLGGPLARAGSALGGRGRVRKTVGDLLNELGTWESEELSTLQRQLFSAGYYGDAKQEEIAFGRVDTRTRAAWGGALSELVYSKTPDQSIDEFLNERAGNRPARLDEEDEEPDAEAFTRPGRIGGGNTNVIGLSDPAAIRSAADQIATALLGRRATDAEKARYAPMIQEIERSTQVYVNTVQENQARRAWDAETASVEAEASWTPQLTASSLRTDQQGHAATIIATGRRLGHSEDEIQVALSVALMESGMRNLDHGDRDSIGLFQQRPSQGYTSGMDPAKQAEQFFGEMRRVQRARPGIPIEELAWRTQRPAAQHRGQYMGRMEEAAQILGTATASPTAEGIGAVAAGAAGAAQAVVIGASSAGQRSAARGPSPGGARRERGGPRPDGLSRGPGGFGVNAAGSTPSQSAARPVGTADGGAGLNGAPMTTTGLVSPVMGQFRYSSGFGPRKAPTAGASSNHGGVDMAAAEGTGVAAPISGVILSRTRADGNAAGNRIHMRGDDGRTYSFYHLSNQAFGTVNAGQRVQAGQQIAAVGSTGVSTGPHLHFEINTVGPGSKQGRIDPMPFLTGAQQIGAAIAGAAGVGPTGYQGPSSPDQWIDSVSVDQVNVDAGARLEEQIKADNPGEYGAKNLNDQYQRFRSFLGGGPVAA